MTFIKHPTDLCPLGNPERQRRTRHKRKFHTILVRDKYTCTYCGDYANTVDHVYPFSLGGSDSDENLVAACRICNALAHDKVFEDVSAKREYLLMKRSQRSGSHEPWHIWELKYLGPNLRAYIFEHGNVADDEAISNDIDNWTPDDLDDDG